VSRWLAALGGLGVLVFAVVATSHPGRTGRALDVLVAYLAAVGLAALVRRLSLLAPPAGRSAIETLLRTHRPARQRPPELARVERRVELGVSHAIDLRASLAPLLRSIAEPLLLLRGIDAEREPERAAALLGDDAWALIRPDAPFPEEPLAPGMPPATLDDLLTRLERLPA
jgi:hypothetical protein